MYDSLVKGGIPVAKYVVVNRDDKGNLLTDFNEYENCIIVNGIQMTKPFVEKPVDAENHNICIFIILYRYLLS